jgi:hypothetical protein
MGNSLGQVDYDLPYLFYGPKFAIRNPKCDGVRQFGEFTRFADFSEVAYFPKVSK